MTNFSRSELAEKQRAFFQEARTPNARKMFQAMVENLAALDRRSTPEADEFKDFAFRHCCFEAKGLPSIYPLLRRLFGYGLEWPTGLRKPLSGRLDLSAARTYSDAAKAAYVALREAAKPVLLEIAGDLLPPDAKDWPVKLD